MKGIHVEVVLAVAYALFLVGASLILEGLARHTHGRARRYRLRGFTFHRHLDVWQCPAGEHLHRRETDHARRLVRYRARAEKCNSCALKALCTDSDEGREVVHSTGDWLETEIGRFHRGISLALLGLGALMVAIAWVRHHSAPESAILAAALASLLATITAFARAYWKDAFGKKGARQDAAGLLSLSPWSDGANRADPFS